MKTTDARLSSARGLSVENMTKAKALHEEGKHDASMKSLQEAKKLLGIRCSGRAAPPIATAGWLFF